MRSLACALVLLTAIFCFAGVLHPAISRDKPKAASAEAAAPKLPDPLTRESIRELVSRLSDAEVRALLIKQLERAGAVLASAAEIPDTLDQVAVRMTEPREPSHLWIVAGAFLLMLGAGALLEIAFARLTRGASRRFEGRAAEGFAAGAVRLMLRTGIGLAHLAAFVVGAIALFFALWQGHEATRFVVLVIFSAVVGVRLFALLARLLL